MDDFHKCVVCRALVSGPHACSPFALGAIRFHEDGPDLSRFDRTRPAVPLTEDDIRRIVREEIMLAMSGNR